MAVRCNGTGDRIFRNANLPASTEFTACCWVQVVSNRSTLVSLVGFTVGGSGNYQILTLESNNQYTVHRTSASQSLGVAPTVGDWEFIALRQLSGQLKGYRWSAGGTLTTAQSAFSTSYTIADFGLGATQFSTSQWPDARFAAVKLWNRGLSDAEVEAERATYVPASTTDLIEFWPLLQDDANPLAGYANGLDFSSAGSIAHEADPPLDWGEGETADLPPDAILASTNLSGTVADIDDDPDSPDSNWLTADDAAAATDLRVSFPTPG